MPRIVLDANVFVSAFIRPSGPPGILLARVFGDGAFQLVVSPAILDELRSTLAYPKLRRVLRLDSAAINARVGAVAAVALVVPGVTAVRAVPEDPDDDIYFSAAIEGLASHIVTGDRALLAVRMFSGVRVVSPRDFLDSPP